MFTGRSTAQRIGSSTRYGRRITALAGALALVAALSGNVAAYPLVDDDSRNRSPLVTPRLDRPTGPSLHMVLKLRTTNGRNVLIYG